MMTLAVGIVVVDEYLSTTQKAVAKLDNEEGGSKTYIPKKFYKTRGSKTYIPKNFYTKTIYITLRNEKFGKRRSMS
ncbi:hypothetical protein Hanom_Chr15g01412141 [Helianthus anomalus]